MKTTMIYKKILLVMVSSGVATWALADPGDSAAGNSGRAPVGNPPVANQPGGTQTPMAPALTAQQFVDDAAIGGMKEIRLSKMALGQSKDPEVISFAHKMVTDHTMANRKLERIAQQEGLTCPATNTFAKNDPNWRNPLVENPPAIKGEGAHLLMAHNPDVEDYEAFLHLKGLSGHEFDVAYARDMVSDHIAAVNEFEAASRDLSDPALRKFAADTLPVLREHSQMAQQLENHLAGQTAEVDQASPGGPVTADAGGR